MKMGEKDFLHLGNFPTGAQQLSRYSFTAIDKERLITYFN
jgi:hypothetical protein